jgi:lipoprotein NlpI
LDQAIRLDPRGADAFADRGAIYMFKGDHARALQDYDQALRLNPNDVFVSFRFESRGWLRFYLGQFAGAGDDFRKALDLDPKNAGAAIAAYLAQSRAGTPGQSDLRQRALTLDLQKWPGAVVRLYLDSTSADSVLPAAHNADAATDRRLQCEAYFYLGEDALLHGRRAEAVRLLQAAIKTGEATAASSSACAAAQTELNRLSVSQPGSR